MAVGMQPRAQRGNGSWFLLTWLATLGLLWTVFWCGGSFEAVFKDLGEKLPRFTVLALDLAALGRSAAGVTTLSLVALASVLLHWTLGRRSLDRVFLALSMVGTSIWFAYVLLLLWTLREITAKIR